VISYIIKAALSFVDLFGRTFIYNSQFPEVSGINDGLHYGTHKKQVIEVISPRHSSKSDSLLPILVFFHGGGWVSGHKRNVRRICASYAQAGFLVFNVNYRLAPKYGFCQQVSDVSSAMEWIVCQAADYGGDVRRIFMGGESAGAHLTSWYTAAINKPELFASIGVRGYVPKESICGLILFFGIYNLKTVLQTGFPLIGHVVLSLLRADCRKIDNLSTLASPIHHVDTGYPPCFICFAEGDWLYTQSLEFADRITRLGGIVKTLFFEREKYPYARHAFILYHFMKCSKEAMKESIQFLNQYA
jgi:acetyl esterase